MNTDLLTFDLDKGLLRRRRRWYYLALILFLLSLWTHQPLLFLATLLTALVGFIPDVWYRRSLRHLYLKQRIEQQHLFFGEEAVLEISIENQKFLPLPWLQIENSITPPLDFEVGRISRLQKIMQGSHTSLWQLWSFQRVRRYYHLPSKARGLHVFGPIKLWSSDPFGWLENDITVPVHTSLLVYPLIAPIESLGLASVHPFGEYATPRRLIEDPLRFAGVRDYELGDDPRRIHWKATAHTGVLRSKIYEPGSLRRLLVLLDTWNYSEEIKDIDTDIQELTITAATSIALWGLDEGYQVGLLTNASIMTSTKERRAGRELLVDEEEDLSKITEISIPGVNLPFDRDPGQYERILTLMARLIPQSTIPIERIIATEYSMFPSGTTIILVSAVSSLTDKGIDHLLELQREGAAIYIALTGETRGRTLPETYNLPVYRLGGKER